VSFSMFGILSHGCAGDARRGVLSAYYHNFITAATKAPNMTFIEKHPP